MDKFLQLTVSGLVTGAIYSIMAAGLVLTYTTSGIFNFAHGAVAFTTAYVFYQLNTGLQVPIVPAMIISVFIFAPLLGLLLDRLLLRRLAKAPVYARIVGTIGLLVALPALTQWLVDTIGVNVLGWDLPGSEAVVQGVPVPGIGPTPADVYDLGHGVVLTSDKVAVFVVAAIAALALWLVLRHTRVGLEMRAVVDRDTLAGLRGVNAARTSSVAWVLTMILAGLGGVLIAPLFILQDTFYALVVLGSLAAVVLGGLRSIPIAFIGGHAARRRSELRRRLPRRHPPRLDQLHQRAAVLGALRARDRAPPLLRSRSIATGGHRGRRLAETRPPRGAAQVATAPALDDLHRRAGRLLAAVDQCELAASRHVRPVGGRAEPGDGHHLLVVRGRHRARRHGEPRGKRHS